MSLIKELAKEKLLYIALQGCRAVLAKELEIPSMLFSMSSNVRQEIVRRAQGQEKLNFPYSYITLTSLAAMKDRQNNYAVQKHGVRMTTSGERATTTKGYLFPISVGLDFHYIDANPEQVLTMSQALVLLSLTSGLNFQISVGELFKFDVVLEIPLETTINVSESNAPELPGATDLNVQMVMHSTIGFFRSVAAVNSSTPEINVLVNGADSFTLSMP